MTNDQINSAIAEVCGWTEISSCTCGFKLSGMPPYWAAHKKHLPDYCADLNAMHDAEGKLTKDQFMLYCDSLWPLGRGVWIAIHATARRRAEAFLRTLGKWEEALA